MVRNYKVSGGEPVSNKKECKEIMDYILEQVYSVERRGGVISSVEEIMKICEKEEYKKHIRYFWNRLEKNKLLIYDEEL